MSRRTELIEKAAGKGLRIHVTDREGWFLIQHILSGAVTLEGHADISALSKLFEDLDLMATYQALVSGVPLDIKSHGDAGQWEVYDLSLPSAEFFLTKVTGGKMVPLVGLQLDGLIQRVKDAKVGAYKLPSKPSKEPTAA